MGYLTRQIQALHDLQRLVDRRPQADNSDVNGEALSEAQFVRFFGTKAKKVRWSKRHDMVGLMILGIHNGIWITRGADTFRRVRAVDIVDDKMRVTSRFLVLKDRDSLSNLQRGLLNWVQ